MKGDFGAITVAALQTVRRLSLRARPGKLGIEPRTMQVWPEALGISAIRAALGSDPPPPRNQDSRTEMEQVGNPLSLPKKTQRELGEHLRVGPGFVTVWLSGQPWIWPTFIT